MGQLYQSFVDKKNKSDLQIRKSAKKLEFIVYGLIILVTIAIMLIVFNLILLS
mgnify:FL=1